MILAALTVTEVVLPLTAPELAVIVTGPVLRAVAAPLTVIDSKVGCEDVHVTVFVMSWDVPSLNAPTAVNCCATPSGIAIVAGVTAIDVSVPWLTVRVVE